MLNGRKAWLVTLILFLGQVINYFDKSVIGLAAVAIMKDLHLSPREYGLVASSFFSLYAVTGILVGLFVANRVSSKPLLAVLVLVWSLAQLPAVLGGSLAALVASRMLLGVGEGPASPLSVSVCHGWFTSDRRNLPTAVVMVGSSVGSLIAGPALSYVMIAYGWRAGFATCGLLGLAWLGLWQAFGASAPGDVRTGALSQPSLLAPAPASVPDGLVWRDPTILGALAVGFAAYWTTAFGVAWLAPLARRLGYGAAATGWIVAAAAGANIVILMAISQASQAMITGGLSSRLARGQVNAACLLGAAVCFAASALAAAPLAKLVLVAVGCALPTVTFALGPALVSEIVPAAARSRFLITIYAAVTVGGFFAPIVAGQLIGGDGRAGFDHALLANAVVILVGGLVGLMLLRPERSLARFARLAMQGA